jgi:hypothetical protein
MPDFSSPPPWEETTEVCPEVSKPGVEEPATTHGPGTPKKKVKISL